jgi:hypothetical protein
MSPGSSVCGPLTGTVEAIYPEYEEPFGPFSPLAPESEWHVRVRVDKVPAPWPYGGPDGEGRDIAPVVADLVLAEGD